MRFFAQFVIKGLIKFIINPIFLSIMESINLVRVFETLNEQRRNLNRCLGYKNNTYQQILSKIETLGFWQRLQVISYLKSVKELLSPEEYEKLWSLPRLRGVAKIMENILYNLKHNLSFPLDSDCFYLKESDFENFSLYGKNIRLDFVLLPYGQDMQIYEFVISGVFMKSLNKPSLEDKAFLHSIDVEFIAGFCRNKCFVVRIVSDVYQETDVMTELKKRYDYGLTFSSIQPRHFQFMQSQMLELRKRLTLWMEYLHKTLLPGNLGQIGLIDMIEHYPEMSRFQWNNIFTQLLIHKRVFSKNLWRKLSAFSSYENVFCGVKMMLQKFDGDYDLPKNVSYFYFVNDTKKAAVRIFWRRGWMAEIFVQNPVDLEFPVLTDKFVYVVKNVKNLQQEPLLQEMFETGDTHYIWY